VGAFCVNTDCDHMPFFGLLLLLLHCYGDRFCILGMGCPSRCKLLERRPGLQPLILWGQPTLCLSSLNQRPVVLEERCRKNRCVIQLRRSVVGFINWGKWLHLPMICCDCAQCGTL
jgi:hypothetical protein